MKNLIPTSLLVLVSFFGCTKPDDDALSSQHQTLLEKEAVIGVINELFIGTDNRSWEKKKSLMFAFFRVFSGPKKMLRNGFSL